MVVVVGVGTQDDSVFSLSGGALIGGIRFVKVYRAGQLRYVPFYAEMFHFNKMDIEN